MRISIQGQPASYHDVAQWQFFGEQGQTVLGRDSFKEVFADLADGRADYAVSAMENSLYGSINEVYDLVLKHGFWIFGEVYLRISHCLIGVPGARLEDVRELHSHPVALAQCEDFIDARLPAAERFEAADTAGSVADIMRWNDRAKAAIASRAAAELHGAEVLAEAIETNHHNYTRFIVMRPYRPTEALTTDKTSMILHVGHTAGALHKALGVFAGRGINLSKIESRPVVGTRWEYMFYVDAEAGMDDPELQAAIAELEGQEQSAAILGSYVRCPLPE